MMFPNAHEGVNKIYKSQIFQLISAALLVLASIFAAIMLVGIQKENLGLVGGMGIGTLLFTLGGSVLSIIALVFYIIGINRAKVDEPTFTKALICVMVSLGCSVISMFFSKNLVLTNILNIVKNLANLAATVFIIFGIQALAKKLNCEDVDNRGKLTLRLLIIIYGLTILASLLASIFAGNEAVATVAGIIGIIATILSIVATVVYLLFLKRAVKMLEA